MCILWLSYESSKLKTKYNFEYTHQILDGNKIEPSHTEYHIRILGMYKLMVIVFIWYIV